MTLLKPSEQSKLWLHGLLAAVIGGAANAGLNSAAIATAKGLGLEVTALNWKTLGIVTLSGGVIALYAFLKQSPLPPRTQTQETTVTVTKETTGE